MAPTMKDADYIDLYEQLLYQRASRGIRPVLYMSSPTDLECSMLMLLDEDPEAGYSESQQPVTRAIGYHLITS